MRIRTLKTYNDLYNEFVRIVETYPNRAEAGRELGISTSGIRNIITGYRSIGEDVAKKIGFKKVTTWEKL